LEVHVRRAKVEDEILGYNVSKAFFPTKTLLVPVQVTSVNDAPELDIVMETQAVTEDVDKPVILSEMFVSDPDAGDHLLSFTFEQMEGHEWNLLYMCDLLGVDIYDPWVYTLDAEGCLTRGVARLQFNATVEMFNSMQRGLGRLRFLPARNWHGAVWLRITVDDLGSGLGAEVREVIQRSLHLIVEPTPDAPRLDFLCGAALPLTTYGRACLEVRGCFELQAGDDTGDEETSMWLSATASDPGVSISLGESASVRIRGEGSPSVQIDGLSHAVRDALHSLIVRPPGNLFAPGEADTFAFEVSVTVLALGQTFNEPLPRSLDYYPRDNLTFPVLVRRVNRAPNIFVDEPSFSSSQLYPTVGMQGLYIGDVDAHESDMMEVSLEVDSDSGGGVVSFVGVQDTHITMQMPMATLNRELQGLQFVFQDANWFGVTGVTLSVSDLGNRGWAVESYHDMYHPETQPQVLTLRDGTVSFFLELDEARQYYSLYSGDFTFEVYCKLLSPGPTSPLMGTTPAPPTEEDTESNTLFNNHPLPKLAADPDTNGTNSTVDVGPQDESSEPLCVLTVDAGGHPVVRVRTDSGYDVGGTSDTELAVNEWHHLAVVVRRFTQVASPGARKDSTIGEVALYIDGALDAAWPLGRGQAHLGPVAGSVLAMAGSPGRRRLRHLALTGAPLGEAFAPWRIRSVRRPPRARGRRSRRHGRG